jgi:predicted PurR-regulated permease PerM
MNVPSKPDADLEKRLSDRLMDVFIRTGLILVMVILCYEIFSPFLSLMVWALILAVNMYPAHQKLANKMGGKQGHAATVMVLAGILMSPRWKLLGPLEAANGILMLAITGAALMAILQQLIKTQSDFVKRQD